MIKAVKTKTIDVDNIRLVVFNEKNEEIASVQYNIRTNWAHIESIKEGVEEDFIITSIENRSNIEIEL